MKSRRKRRTNKIVFMNGSEVVVGHPNASDKARGAITAHLIMIPLTPPMS